MKLKINYHSPFHFARCKLMAQNADLQNFIGLGIQLYDKGDYNWSH